MQCEFKIWEEELETCLSLYVRRSIDAYRRGHHSGLNWPDRWETNGRPNGPFVYMGNKITKDGIDAAQSAFENRLWRDGWRDGHAEKLRGRKNLARFCSF
jgi:hypothetical protein